MTLRISAHSQDGERGWLITLPVWPFAVFEATVEAIEGERSSRFEMTVFACIVGMWLAWGILC